MAPAISLLAPPHARRNKSTRDELVIRADALMACPAGGDNRWKLSGRRPWAETASGMYSIFPYVCDAIRDFTRRLAPTDSVAIYTFSRNLFRAAPLTQNHVTARAGLSNISAGDDTALFNSILLTLRDAALVPGLKALVVFSNGPDNAGVIAPTHVARATPNKVIPIYVISTRTP